ncbi:Hypothetical protein A7982_04515 [Minicystis rosea]|nr:Hypothetical protein A7982_04515 [Minicystis rosea]
MKIKASAGDLRREMLEKSTPFRSYAAACWIAVPAPWHRVVPSKSLLPDGWALLSVGTDPRSLIVPAPACTPVERLSSFELALLRTAVANTGEHAARDAPPV